MNRVMFTTVAALLACVVGSLQAADVVVKDLSGDDGWIVREVRAGGAIGTSDEMARNGDGSLKIYTNAGAETSDELSAAKASVIGGVVVDGTPVAIGTLGDLSRGAMTLDVFRDAASTSTANQAVNVRLIVQNAGGEWAELVWERIYQSTTTWDEGVWYDDLDLTSGRWWQRNAETEKNINWFYSDTYLSDWVGGVQHTSDGVPSGDASIILGDDTLVFGVELGVGSWVRGELISYVDDLQLTFVDDEKAIAGSYGVNFEVPEPASLALVALGGLMLCGRRRKA